MLATRSFLQQTAKDSTVALRKYHVNQWGALWCSGLENISLLINLSESKIERQKSSCSNLKMYRAKAFSNAARSLRLLRS
jgi:hypothetical protein